jgi:hypothetical protein
MKSFTLAMAAFLLLASPATAEIDVASDTEIRVAYCLGVSEAQTAFTDQIKPGAEDKTKFAEEMRAADRAVAARRARMTDYLKARGLDARGGRPNALNGIIIAKRRGSADFEFLGSDGKCDKCEAGAAMKNCIDECRSADPIWQSVSRCNENSSLPY